MAVKNTYTVYVNGHNLTAYAVMPLKWGDYLDESLDECYLSLRNCPISVFKPLLPVEVVITNTIYVGSKTIKTHTDTRQYYVADTSEGQETPPGSGKYNHTLYLIEPTKYLERHIVDSVTYTNDIGRNYADGTIETETESEEETEEE